MIINLICKTLFNKSFKQVYLRKKSSLYIIDKQTDRMNSQQLMIEEYYGFPGNRPSVQSFPRERSSQRTERSPRPDSRKLKSPPNRILKRTQLSKEKLSCKDSKKRVLPPLPELNRQQTNREQAISHPNNQGSSEERVGNRQELEMMVKKYDNYMRADSVEFTNREISHTNNGSNFINQFRFRPDSREGQCNPRINYYHPQSRNQQYIRYQSVSQGRKTEFLSNFQRIPPTGNAIDRANQNISSRTNTPRYKKSKSLTNTIKKKYIMHTFYHAQRKQFYNYNQDGYLTERQAQLLNRLEEKARKAFDRALFQNQSSKREDVPQKKQTRTRKFEVQDSSRMQHRNSDILDDLKLNEISRYNSIPMATKRPSNRSNHEERVVDMSINPAKEENNYDDYQMKQSTKNIPEVVNNHSISKYLDEKQSHLKQQNYAVQQKSKYQSENDDSLLQFRPIKRNISGHKSQKNISKEPSKQAEKQPSVTHQKESEKEFPKKNSELSDYRSVDMMGINSNCRFEQKDKQIKTSKQMKQSEDMKESKQSKEKLEANSDDNRSLGINTIKSFDPYKKKNNQSSQRSSLSESQSSSQSSSLSGTISEGESVQSSHMKTSHKLSRSGSNKEKSSLSDGDFTKNKVKASHSASQLISDCIKIEISKPPDISDKPITMMKKKQKSEVNASESEIKKSSQINGSSIKKIKRLKKSENSVSQSIESNQKIENGPKIDSLSALGMQSFPQFDHIEPLQVKIAPLEGKDMSPIEQDTQKVHSYTNSRFNQAESPIKSKNRHSINNSIYNSQHSVSIRSKMRSQRFLPLNQNHEYDLFTEVRDFIQDEQYNYHQTRKEKQNPELISPQLDDVLNKIQEHLYLLNCIAELILIVPDLYDFQTIYNKEYEWIFLSVFLTLKKYMFERQRVVTALAGGKNCFNILDIIIQNDVLEKYRLREEIVNIKDNLVECNGKLDVILNNFYQFLVNFKKLAPNDTYFHLKPFSNSEQLYVLLSQYDKQIDTLKKKRQEQFNGGHLQEQDEDEYHTLMIVNERIFRLMQIGFVIGNLAGRQLKAYQKDEELFKGEEDLKHYIVENEQMFKQMIKYFK